MSVKTITALVAAVIGAFTLVPIAAADAGTSSTSAASDRLRAQLRSGAMPDSYGLHALCGHVGCQALEVTRSKTSTLPLTTSTPLGLGAGELQAAYHLPGAAVGQRGTVALIETGAYPRLGLDLARYRARYHLPACTTDSGCLTVMNYRGGPPLKPATTEQGKALEQYGAVETALDLDMVSAACPNCRLIEIQAPQADLQPPSRAANDAAASHFGTAVRTAVAHDADAVSISYGFYADHDTDTGTTAQDLFQPGVAVLASSGDFGYNGNTRYYGPSTSPWPENLPWVVSVGGTSLYQSHQHGVTSYRQTAWEFAGSGCGLDETAATGQPDAISNHCDGHRAATDISAVADPGVAVYDSYEPSYDAGPNWYVVEGTSVSTPFVAALYARAGNLTGVIGPNTLYAAPTGAFDDVTSGQNVLPNECMSKQLFAVCHAGAGWDGPTGLGTPHGLAGF